jgi:hypothetical protein
MITDGKIIVLRDGKNSVRLSFLSKKPPIIPIGTFDLSKHRIGDEQHFDLICSYRDLNQQEWENLLLTGRVKK